MNENHHAAAAGSILSGDKAWTVGWETVDAQHLAAHIEASVEATLAVAYEQRTANLIAACNAEVSGQGRLRGDGIVFDRHNEILDRLGL